ncbi:EscT/YscT/HrcT family type III secretion system export apparatus protein [Pseudomonas sp. FSL R10-0056]|uniref:type III secretion system export apparatus subunit SctT n=1 Tax=Pseudomonas TaxID=286 RepID=UPI001296DBD4|nr:MULTISPECIES: type III secretion system export apparatus subunit SctT [unclassified Pseudomonas]MDN5391698.1 type III secretion system export apparatus subunit SctT [Pseudomonas sp.]MDN5393227.1 type III secretion system export apparatus subunit SctT [Pseudomonas sp.]MDN5407139.1 type III secretion system export apparatus subunit SctT [Pseudomonas sp.]MDN5448064.1 type III secretion system export apparatus subunit SctT [Pseudomonas sp.]MDN5453738.1 type III secretion system export apparatus
MAPQIAFLEYLPSLAIAMARLYPCFFLIPAFCFEHVRGMPRHVIVFALALIPAPGIYHALSGVNYTLLALGGLMLKEAMLGFLLGMLLSMPFWLFESVGALLDNQRGALIGGQLNPSLGADATPVGHLFKQLSIFLLMVTLGLGSLTRVIWDSYLIWPPTLWLPTIAADGFAVFLSLLGDTFTHLVLYAAPFIALLLLIEFAVALLSLYSPQLQVFVLSMPAKSLAGLGFLLLYLPQLEELIVGRMSLLGDLGHALGQLFKVGES